MWNEPTKERLNKMPQLYETENISLKEKLVPLHFFIGGSDWYICETDGKDIMWGFCILNNDYEMAEWGYVSLSELRSIEIDGWLEVDCELEEIWEVKKAVDVDKIRIAQGWSGEGKGLSCPFCGSSSIQGGFIEIEAGKALQGMECTECEAHWQDVYELIDINPYPVKEVTNERIPDKAPGLAGLLGQHNRN